MWCLARSRPVGIRCPASANAPCWFATPSAGVVGEGKRELAVRWPRVSRDYVGRYVVGNYLWCKAVCYYRTGVDDCASLDLDGVYDDYVRFDSDVAVDDGLASWPA